MSVPSDQELQVIPVTRVVYKDGSQELFSKGLQMRVVGGWLEFCDDDTRVFSRHTHQVDRIEDVDVFCGGSAELIGGKNAA